MDWKSSDVGKRTIPSGQWTYSQLSRPKKRSTETFVEMSVSGVGHGKIAR